jgi:GABA(A) receptor-associated protein
MVTFFKNEYSIDIRKRESKQIMNKYTDRVPIIVEPHDDKCPIINKKKYLAPHDITLGQFTYVIRKHLKLKPEQAIFIIINHTLVSSSENIITIYEKHKDDDDFLYVVYSLENTFG